MRNIAVCQPDAYLKGVSRYFYTKKKKRKQAVGKHVILPSEKVMAPANTNAAYSPMLKPAVLTQFSMACRKKSNVNNDLFMCFQTPAKKHSLTGRHF